MRTVAILALVQLVASTATADPSLVTTPRFTVPLPDGYADVSRQFHKPNFVALEAKQPRLGYRPTIVFQQVPIAGGSMGDAATCTSTGKSMATGLKGQLKRAAIIPGPLGRTCQMHIVAPEGVALITELNFLLPPETWLMTCNHADGDTTAERVCKEALAGFKATKK
jgi:hypothetical protein